jgi:predicted transcriptional regulator
VTISSGKTGFTLYARVVARLKIPATARELATDIGITPCTALALTREMRSLGLLHVQGWRRVGSCGKPDRVYAFGLGEDAPAPLTNGGKPGKVAPPRKCRPRAAVIAFASMLSALETPMTTLDLAEECGIARATALEFLRVAHSVGLVGIAAWNPSGSLHAPAYALGVKKDKLKPQPESKPSICRRYRANLKARERNLVLSGLVSIVDMKEAA